MNSEVRAQEARCWCGNAALREFLVTYARCSECGTLVSLRGLSADEVDVRDDDRDFYGREYWFARQRDQLGLPDIYERARSDLPERCLYWLRALLRFALPPARVLDLGSGHGGFVALMRWAGFDASGLELSPWVVDFARKTFGIPMRRGPLETHALPSGSFNVIVLNDVLEHLVDPLGLIRQCAGLLRPHGFVLVQTPCYPDPQTHQDLVDAEHPVLAMLQEREHLYLFSRRSVRQLFEQVGFHAVHFEPALFPYDMFLLASRSPLTPTEAAARNEVLRRSPSARLVRAMIDLDDRARDLSAQVLQIEQDRQTRIQAIERLNHHLEQVRVDYDARLKVILDQQATIDRLSQDLTRLSQHLEGVSVDYEARLKVILDQQATIDRLGQDLRRLGHHLEQINVDYDTRLKVILDQQATINRLGREAARAEAERHRLLEQQAGSLAKLTAQGQNQLDIIARQQATIEALDEEKRRVAREVQARLLHIESRQETLDALVRTRLVRLLRQLRIL